MTTWNCSRYWPMFVATDASMLEPQRVHLKLVIDGGLGHQYPQTVAAVLSFAEGLSEGSRSA